MKIEYIFTTIAFACIILMLFNRKVNVLKVFVEQLKVFKNNRTKKTSFLDILSFIICPIVLSLIMVLWYEFYIDRELSQILTTTFSLVFTLMLAFEAILVSKKDSTNVIEKEVISQTFISVVSSSILSLIGIILSVVIMFITNCTAVNIITILVSVLSFMTVMLLLMIIKRTFMIFMNDSKK